MYIYTYIVSHNYAEFKVDSCNFLPLEKAMTFRNVKILIKSVRNTNESNSYYIIFLENSSYELPEK